MAKGAMSKKIEEACLEVARTNMWDNRPVDAFPMIEYQKEMVAIALRALESFEGLGATEQDVADAIHYIEQVYALPPIGNDLDWFDKTLFTILEPAFPNSSVSGAAARFAEKLVSGIRKQIE